MGSEEVIILKMPKKTGMGEKTKVEEQWHGKNYRKIPMRIYRYFRM